MSARLSVNINDTCEAILRTTMREYGVSATEATRMAFTALSERIASAQTVQLLAELESQGGTR